MLNSITEINNKSFDISFVLSSIFLWLLFGFFSSLINCDIQKIILQNPIYMYISAFISFFFLFVIIDNNNSIPLYQLWIKTFIVFIMFVMLTKTKFYFSVLVVILLLTDQSILYHLKYIQKNNLDQKNIDLYNKIRFYINISIYVIIFIGFLHYMIRKYHKHGNSFSVKDFLLSKCNL